VGGDSSVSEEGPSLAVVRKEKRAASPAKKRKKSHRGRSSSSNPRKKLKSNSSRSSSSSSSHGRTNGSMSSNRGSSRRNTRSRSRRGRGVKRPKSTIKTSAKPAKLRDTQDVADTAYDLTTHSDDDSLIPENLPMVSTHVVALVIVSRKDDCVIPIDQICILRNTYILNVKYSYTSTLTS
jgi:hypothetical protein